MRVLLLNGSPRKEKSCTIRVAHKFVDGLRAAGDCEVEEINISDCRITPCLGCLSCWGRTEGECVIKNDDIPMLKEKILAAKRAGITDIVICKDNEKDILDIPEKYLKGVSFHYVEDVADVWEFALTDEKVEHPINFTIPENDKKEEK